jgi:hypothetical protein
LRAAGKIDATALAFPIVMPCQPGGFGLAFILSLQWQTDSEKGGEEEEGGVLQKNKEERLITRRGSIGG